MKTFGQFSEDIEQRRQELRQRRLDQMKAQKDKVAEYQAQQKERVAAAVEAQKQKTSQRMEKQRQDTERRIERRNRAIASAISKRKPRRKVKKRVRTPQVRKPVTGNTSSTGTPDTQRP